HELQPTSKVALAGLLSQDLTEKKYDSARTRVEAALAGNPKDAALLLLAGNAYAAMGDVTKALTAYETVLQVDPANIEAFGKLGVLYHSEGRLEEAKQKFEELTRRHDKPVAALTFLGLIAELQKNPSEARIKYQRAL